MSDSADLDSYIPTHMRSKEQVENIMVSEEDEFYLSGPKHLTDVDWNCPDYRRSVAASLVKAIYVLQREQSKNISGSMARAPTWWKFFNFELKNRLNFDASRSIFGGIYEYKDFARFSNDAKLAKVPRYVIAFQGTQTPRDYMSNFRLLFNILHKSSRCKPAMEAVQNMVSLTETSNIWLAGHSLGSAIATLVGRDMAMKGVFLESFLFNPPYISAPKDWVKNEKVKCGIQIAGGILTAGLATTLTSSSQRSRLDEDFTNLSPWIPNLFVNPKDSICCGYIDYFNDREMMKNKGLGSIADVATKHSKRDLILGSIGMDSYPFHLLPSARLYVNRSYMHKGRFRYLNICRSKEAHEICQWWKPDLEGLKFKLYKYK